VQWIKVGPGKCQCSEHGLPQTRYILHIYIYIYIFEGFAPATGPLGCWQQQQQLTGWLLKWVTFFNQTLPVWWPWGCILGTRVDLFGDPGVHGETQQALGGPDRCPFELILGSLGSTHIRLLFVTCLWFWLSSWETASRSMFLVIQGGSDARMQHLYQMVFDVFHFFYFFTKWVSGGWF